MSGLSASASLLWTATSAFAGETVVYSRQSNTVTLTAIPSRPELFTDDTIASRLEAESLDWTLLAASLVLSSLVVEPKEGDRITRINGEVYELTEIPYRLSDSEGIRLRIHAKKVAG